VLTLIFKRSMHQDGTVVLLRCAENKSSTPGRHLFPLREMTPQDHRGGANFKKNHPNTGQEPSQIDRNKFKQDRQKHWKGKAEDKQS
jgi:hypothetical protein